MYFYTSHKYSQTSIDEDADMINFAELNDWSFNSAIICHFIQISCAAIGIIYNVRSYKLTKLAPQLSDHG